MPTTCPAARKGLTGPQCRAKLPEMSEVTVSIVIPVKNDAELLPRCLAALEAQSRPADEIIVVDNGSTDGSDEVATRAGARVIHEPRPGIPAAAAAGADAASSTVIARLDADCIPPRDWVSVIAEYFAAHPDVAAITGGAVFIDGPRPLRRLLAVLYLGAYYLTAVPVLGHMPLFGSNDAFRRDAWLEVAREVHRGDSEVHDDFDLSFHLGPDRPIRFVRQMRMGISMRPFADARAFAKRTRRGGHTIAVHWPGELPWRRWAR